MPIAPQMLPPQQCSAPMVLRLHACRACVIGKLNAGPPPTVTRENASCTETGSLSAWDRGPLDARIMYVPARLNLTVLKVAMPSTGAPDPPSATSFPPGGPDATLICMKYPA